MRLNAYRQEKVRGEMTVPAILTEETLGLLSLGRNLFREPFDPYRNQSNLQPRGQAGKAPMREVRSFLTHLPCLPALPPATRSFVSHFCTFARGEAAFAPLHGFLTSPCPRAYALYPLSTCQLANRPANLSRSCQPAHWSTDQLNITLVWFRDPKVRPDPVFGANHVQGLKLLMKANKAEPGGRDPPEVGLGPGCGSSSDGPLSLPAPSSSKPFHGSFP